MNNVCLSCCLSACLLVGCEPVEQLIDGVVAGCVVPAGEDYSDASDPDCTGVAVWPEPGRDPEFSDQIVWVVDVSGAEEGSADIECTFVPHADSCPPDPSHDGSPWSLGLGGHGSAVGTEYGCLCADVSCSAVGSGEVLRAWTWELGSCAG